MTISSTNGYRTTNLINQNQYWLLQPDVQEQTGVEAIIMTTSNGATDGDIPGTVMAPASQLPILWSLVTGIDPAAERKLVGLDSAIVEGHYLADNDGFAVEKVLQPGSDEAKATVLGDLGGTRQMMLNHRANPNGPDLPVIFTTNSYVNLPTQSNLHKLTDPVVSATSRTTWLHKTLRCSR